MLQEIIVDLISEKCPSEWELVVFKGHILVYLPEMEGDFLPRYREVKKEITNCVTKNLPVLNEEVLFEVRSDAWNCSFKLGKMLIT
ncbi:hypothetical protein [Mucilaginibacter sp.]